MDGSSKSLGVWEYSTGLIAAVIGNVLFVWPGHVVAAAGENALGSIAGIIGAILVSGLLHHKGVLRGRQSLALRRLLVVSAGIGLGLVGLVDLALVALLTQMLHTLFYADTPRWALFLPLVAMVIWAGSVSLDALGRLTQLWVPVGGLVLAVIAAIGLMHATHVRPLWPQHWYAIPMAHGVGIMAYLLLPVGPVVTCLAPYVNATVQSIRRGFLLAAATISLILLAIYGLVTVMLGPDAIPQLRWPLVYSLETITLDSTFFISRIGLAIIFLWTAVVVLAFAVHVRLAVHLIPLSARRSSFWLSGALGLLYGIGLVAFPTPSASTAWILRVIDPVALGYLVLEHAVVLAMSAIVSGRDKRPSTANGESPRGSPGSG